MSWTLPAPHCKCPVWDLRVPVCGLWPLFREPCPYLSHACPLNWKHAILEAIETLPVDWWEELTGQEKQDDAG